MQHFYQILVSYSPLSTNNFTKFVKRYIRNSQGPWRREKLFDSIEFFEIFSGNTVNNLDFFWRKSKLIYLWVWHRFVVSIRSWRTEWGLLKFQFIGQWWPGDHSKHWELREQRPEILGKLWICFCTSIFGVLHIFLHSSKRFYRINKYNYLNYHNYEAWIMMYLSMCAALSAVLSA